MPTMTEKNEIETWPDLALGLYDKLTGRGAEITYEFENLRLGVPRSASPDAPMANWTVSGTLRVRTRDRKDA